MDQARRLRYVGISAVVALTATGLGAVGPQGVYRALTDPLAMIRHFSPGGRAAGALTNKFRRVAHLAPASAVRDKIRPEKVALRRPKPVFAVLPTAVAAPVPVAVTSVPIAAAASPLPAAITPLLAGGGGAIGLLPILAGTAVGGTLLAIVVSTSHNDASPR